MVTELGSGGRRRARGGRHCLHFRGKVEGRDGDVETGFTWLGLSVGLVWARRCVLDMVDKGVWLLCFSGFKGKMKRKCNYYRNA